MIIMKTELVFYDQNGRPIAYCEDGEYIYLYSGTPVAYFYEDSIYSFKGKHLGRFSDGWLRDNDGNCALFTEDATSGVMKPMRKMRPIKKIKKVKPMKSIKKMKPMKKINKRSWSSYSSELFFDQ